MDDGSPQPFFKTTREMLELAVDFHRRVKRHWEGLQAATEDPPTDMLVGYIRDNERRFVNLVSRYLATAPGDLLDTYFQFAPEEVQQAQSLEDWRPASGADPDAVLAAALDADAFIEKYYRRAAELASREAVRDMFRRLADGIAEKRKAQAQNANWLADI